MMKWINRLEGQIVFDTVLWWMFRCLTHVTLTLVFVGFFGGSVEPGGG